MPCGDELLRDKLQATQGAPSAVAQPGISGSTSVASWASDSCQPR